MRCWRWSLNGINLGTYLRNIRCVGRIASVIIRQMQGSTSEPRPQASDITYEAAMDMWTD